MYIGPKIESGRQIEFLTKLVVYGVATVSRIDKIIGLFCRIASLL